MLASCRHPLVFKAREPRKGKLVEASFERVLEREIPEYSSREFEAAVGDVRVETHEAVDLCAPTLWRGGKLYRRLSARDDSGAEACALPVYHERNPWNDVVAYHRWRRTLTGVDTKRNNVDPRIWPPVEFDVDARKWVSYAPYDLAERLESVDGASLAESEAMFEAQLGKLVAIDGAIWRETRPPAYLVKAKSAHDRLSIEVDYLPDMPDFALYSRRFPLSDFDAAVDWHRSMPPISAWGTTFNARRARNEEIPRISFDLRDRDRVAFDPDVEDYHRAGLVLATSLGRQLSQRNFHPIHEGAPPLFDPEEAERFTPLKEALDEYNPILGRVPDFTAMLPVAWELWCAKGGKHYGPVLAANPGRTTYIFLNKDLPVSSTPIALGGLVAP